MGIHAVVNFDVLVRWTITTAW